jgi:hypothetical protein
MVGIVMFLVNSSNSFDVKMGKSRSQDVLNRKIIVEGYLVQDLESPVLSKANLERVVVQFDLEMQK